MFRTGKTRFGSALVVAACAVLVSECGGPESFRGGPGVGTGGQAGSQIVTGTGSAIDASPADATGVAGSTAGVAGGGGGVAGTGGSMDASVVDATGVAGGTMGVAGSGGGGVAGTTGTAGATGAAGTLGTAGATGAAGMSGQGGAGGNAGSSGGADAGTDAPAGCDCMLKVQYECRQNGASVLSLEYSIKIVNTGTTTIALNDVTVRYWYTIDGTGAQSGVCASAAHPCTIAFQSTAAKATADEYGVISFAGGTLAPGADTGEIQLQILGTGMYNQTNDYSFSDSGANFTDDTHLTGYFAGKLMWGTAP
jgi:endoglucanase